MKLRYPRPLPFALALVAALSLACAPAAAPTATTAPVAKPTTAAAPVATTAPATKPTTAAAQPTSVAKPAAKEPLKPLSPPVTVKVASLGSASDSGMFIALEKGYFKELGIEIDRTNIASSSEMWSLLATGQLDIGGGGLGPGLFNAIQRGVPLKIIADKGSTPKGFGFQSIMVRKDLIDNGSIKSFADLKGRTIGVSAASVDSVVLNQAMTSVGLSLNDLKLTEMGFPDMVPALANGSIDAATVIEPFATRALSQGAVRWKTVDTITPNQQMAIFVTSPMFEKNQPEVLKRFVLAYIKGVRDYNDAFVKGINKDAIIAILTKTTTVKDPELYSQMIPPGLNPDGRVDAGTVISAQDVWATLGLVDKKIDVNTMIDEQYIKFAVEQLGPYK